MPAVGDRGSSNFNAVRVRSDVRNSCRSKVCPSVGNSRVETPHSGERGYVSLIAVRGIVGAILLGTCIGCGGNSAPEPVTGGSAVTSPASGSATTQSGTSDTSTVAAAATQNKSTHARDEVWVDEKGQKWFGNVPMDAFFDEPYTIASDQTSLAPLPDVIRGADPVPIPVPNPVSDPIPPTAVADVGGDDSWGSLISATALDEEVKSIRNFMNENLPAVGTFNSSMLMLPPKAAALAALAEVAAKHPDAVSWKDDAVYIRDLAKKMNSSTLERGAKDQKRLLGLFESVSDILNRSRPAGLEEPPATDSFAEAAEMRLLMMRMDEAEKRMRTEAGTEGAMSSRKDMISHEASMMAVMAKIVTLPGYGYEDDAEFKGYAGEIVQAAQSIKVSAESNDFATYEGALSKISTTCQKCHSKYKND